MGELLIRNVRLLNPGAGTTQGDLFARAGRIMALGSNAISMSSSDTTFVEGGGRLLTPGLIDLHTHGIGTHLYETGPEGLRGAAGELGRYGVTTVLPTLVPQIRENWLERLAAIAAGVSQVTEVNVPGLHIEGPFMAVGGAACPTLPGDVGLLEKILEACGGRLAAMSVSPDAPDIGPIISRLKEEGVRVFVTHTRADVPQTEAAIAAGATHATHFYNVFYPPAESEPGVRPVGAVEVCLADARVSVDFIADGVHVDPMGIRAAVAAKTWRGVVLITDSNIGAGLPAGTHETPWGYPVRVDPDDAARHATEGFLAGSALTMNRGMLNLHRWLDLPTEQIWAMGTLNPARVMGLSTKGRLAVGADADLVLWDDGFKAARTWVGGRCVYKRM